MNKRNLLLCIFVILIIALSVYLSIFNNKLYSPGIDPPPPLPCGCVFNGITYTSGQSGASAFFPFRSGPNNQWLLNPHTIVVTGCEGSICPVEKPCTITASKDPGNIVVEGECKLKI